MAQLDKDKDALSKDLRHHKQEDKTQKTYERLFLKVFFCGPNVNLLRQTINVLGEKKKL